MSAPARTARVTAREMQATFAATRSRLLARLVVGVLALVAALTTYGSAENVQGVHGWLWPLVASVMALVGVVVAGWGAAAASASAHRHQMPKGVVEQGTTERPHAT